MIQCFELVEFQVEAVHAAYLLQRIAKIVLHCSVA